MGRSVDLYSYDKKQLVEEICKYCKTEDTDLIYKILNSFGSTINDRYILLKDEFAEEYCSYYEVSTVLDKVFNSDNIFGNVFCTFNELADRKELISHGNAYESFLDDYTGKIFELVED